MLCMVNKETFKSNSKLVNTEDHILSNEGKHTYVYCVSAHVHASMDLSSDWLTDQPTNQPTTHILTNHIVILILSGQGLYTLVFP
jgi:hypothetical protein